MGSSPWHPGIPSQRPFLPISTGSTGPRPSPIQSGQASLRAADMGSGTGGRAFSCQDPAQGRLLARGGAASSQATIPRAKGRALGSLPVDPGLCRHLLTPPGPATFPQVPRWRETLDQVISRTGEQVSEDTPSRTAQLGPASSGRKPGPTGSPPTASAQLSPRSPALHRHGAHVTSSWGPRGVPSAQGPVLTRNLPAPTRPVRFTEKP